MQIVYFTISVHEPGPDASKLNQLLASHPNAIVEQRLMHDGLTGYWAVAVRVPGDSVSAQSDAGKRTRVDYREILSEVHFSRFSIMREFRTFYCAFVAHHALINNMDARLERALLPTVFACRIGKGVHAAIRYAQHQSRRCIWVMHTDIRGYFPSIDHCTLRKQLNKCFKGDGLQLIESVLAVYHAADERKLRSAYRNYNEPGNRNDNIGFRLAGALPTGKMTDGSLRSVNQLSGNFAVSTCCDKRIGTGYVSMLVADASHVESLPRCRLSYDAGCGGGCHGNT